MVFPTAQEELAEQFGTRKEGEGELAPHRAMGDAEELRRTLFPLGVRLPQPHVCTRLSRKCPGVRLTELSLARMMH